MSCVRAEFCRLCLDLNLDVETRESSWKSYEEIRRHYLLEGDQLHWLAVSLYISCRRGEDEENEKRKTSINPISLSRLLLSSNQFSLLSFFVKLHQWEDMSNLPDYLRRQIDRLEKGFRFSSCLFHKYPSMFSQIFRCSSNILLHCHSSPREQINPKFQRTKKSSLIEDLFFVCWTVFSLSKTLYRSTFHDLTASFHLLIASFQYLSRLTVELHLDALLVPLPRSSVASTSSYPVIEHLCRVLNGREEIATNIFEEHFPEDFLFSSCLSKMSLTTNPAENLSRYRREIDRCYDEVILRECLIDERIFFDEKNQFVDLLDSFNENRNQKTSLQRTPLSAHSLLPPPSSPVLQGLTPISQTKQFIEQLLNIIGDEQEDKPSGAITDLLQETYLDDLINRVEEWKRLFLDNYHLEGKTNVRRSLPFADGEEKHRSSTNLSERYFQIGLKLFYRALEKIFVIERKRSHNDQSLHQLLFNNEFLKSLLGLSLLLVFFAHGDDLHDFHWMFSLYSLHGYSFLKIIQIFLRTLKEFHQTRSFIKYLSRIEETILSSMVWKEDSTFWKDLNNKGFLNYQQIFPDQQQQLETPTRFYSPQSPMDKVSRKLFDSSSTEEKRRPTMPIKSSPYTMFFRQVYQLIGSRIGLLTRRLFADEEREEKEEILWNFILYLLESALKDLLQCRDLDSILLSSLFYLCEHHFRLCPPLTWSRLISIYQSMPNATLKTLRSVFIGKQDDFSPSMSLNTTDNPSLTPSKPAGTIHLIDGKFFGDVNSFYEQIFLKQNHLQQFFEVSRPRLPLPRLSSSFSDQRKMKLKISSDHSIDYSSTRLPRDLSSHSEPFHSFTSQSAQQNILSSSIQAGVKNTVQTTRTRTMDGKFLTTISTVSSPMEMETSTLNQGENQRDEAIFGQSTLKRTISNQSFNNNKSLNSLKKKVLQIENDRQEQQRKDN